MEGMEGNALMTATTYFVRLYYDGEHEEIPDEDVAIFAKSQVHALMEAKRLHPEADRTEIVPEMRVSWSLT